MYVIKYLNYKKKIVRILSLSKYNAHTDALFNNMKPLKVNDILQLQELKFYYKYKNNKLPHYLQALPFHSNTQTHDHNTRSKIIYITLLVNMRLLKTVFTLIYLELQIIVQIV